MEAKHKMKAWMDGVVSAILVAAGLVILTNGLRGNPTDGQAAAGQRDVYRAENIESKKLSIKLHREQYDAGELIAIEFADFECRFCRLFANELLPQLRDEAQFVFRHFPLAERSTAIKAATSAICAEKQGKFWQAHNIFFAEPAMMNSDIADLAGRIGLEPEVFARCVGSALNEYQLDQREGTLLGVNSTPQFFFGRVDQTGLVTLTRRIVGAQPIEVFEEVIAGFRRQSGLRSSPEFRTDPLKRQDDLSLDAQNE